jgi:hypothetical protein
LKENMKTQEAHSPRPTLFREVEGENLEGKGVSPLLIPEEASDNLSRPVSWLGASQPFSLPIPIQTVAESKTSPLTVAGPRRNYTGFPNTLSCTG